MFDADRRYWAGRRVWIVGASTGIGLALAKTVAAAGAVTIVSSRSSDALEQLVTEQEQLGYSCHALPMDVSRQEDVDEGAARLSSLAGGVDMLIYSAGAWEPVDLPAIDPKQAAQQAEVNYLGLVRCSAAVFGDMAVRGDGAIVGVTSASAYAPLPRAETYGASKAAATYYLQSLRIDARKHGVRVVTVAPGFVDTPLTRRNDFKMPFMVTTDRIAAVIVAGLEQGHSEIHGPKRLTLALKLLGALPRPIKEWTVGTLHRR
jgi:short-subunit dehydrogenase